MILERGERAAELLPQLRAALGVAGALAGEVAADAEDEAADPLGLGDLAGPQCLDEAQEDVLGELLDGIRGAQPAAREGPHGRRKPATKRRFCLAITGGAGGHEDRDGRFVRYSTLEDSHDLHHSV